ncbi:MAG: hypothetical protein IJZ90_04865, partial [Clostridia bacterium]|nr:hypothetical protein [Clostridia bacterium]
MIIERDTQRYTISTSRMISDAFESAYSEDQDGPIVAKPDFAVTVCSTLSMLILFAMCFMTYLSKGKETMWLVISVIFLILPVYFFYKDFKKLAQYKAVNSVDTSKHAAKKEFESLFGENLEEKMSAASFLRVVAPLASKPAIMKNYTARDGVRFLVNALNVKNNPPDLLCKNMTSYGKILSQTRHRYYVKREDSNFIFYDQDFMNPAG